jgi:hypothetical protein
MQLNDARSEALMVVSTALEPLLPGLARAVHAALAPLVLAPSSLGSLAAFSGAQQAACGIGFIGRLVGNGEPKSNVGIDCLLVPPHMHWPPATDTSARQSRPLLLPLCCRCVPAAPSRHFFGEHSGCDTCPGAVARLMPPPHPAQGCAPSACDIGWGATPPQPATLRLPFTHRRNASRLVRF